MAAFLLLLFSPMAIEDGSLSSEELDNRVTAIVSARRRCGPTAVWYCLRRLGRDVRVQEVFDRVAVGSEGVSAQALLDLCSSFGAPAKGVFGSRQNIESLPIPSILIIDSRHCVVYEGISPSGQEVRVFEPTNAGLRTVSMEVVQRQWTGEAIVFSEPQMSLAAFMCVIFASMVGLASVVILASQRLAKGETGNAIGDQAMRPSRTGFTLAELLVVIAILGVLMALILPAIMFARKAAHKTECANNLRQIGIALNNYHQAEHVLPPGCSYQDGKGPQPHMSWLARLLPYVERDELWRVTLEAYAQEKSFLVNPPHVGLNTVIPTFLCPSDGRPGYYSDSRFLVAYTSYLGMEGTNQFKKDGVLFLDSRVRITDVRDGSSHTLFVGERPASADGGLGWWYAGWGQSKDGSGDMVLGVREHNVRSPWAGSAGCPVGVYEFGPPRGNDCDAFHFWSHHPGGAHFLFGDNSVRFLRYSAAPLMPALATRAGREPVQVPD